MLERGEEGIDLIRPSKGFRADVGHQEMWNGQWWRHWVELAIDLLLDAMDADELGLYLKKQRL